MGITSQKYSPISSIFLFRSDVYATTGEDAALHSFATSHLWTILDDWSHCAHREASEITNYREKLGHATYAVPFARTRMHKFMSLSNSSRYRSKRTLCRARSRITHFNDGILSMSPSCFTSHARMRELRRRTYATSSRQ